jgi:alkylresorcinol/alkylpyrone synthase
LNQDGAATIEPTIRAIGRALPKHHLGQEQRIAALRGLRDEKHFNVERLEDLHRAVQVSGRYLALPLEAYAGLDTFQKSNDAFIEVAQDLGAKAMQDALARAGLAPRDVDHVFFVTVTGIATPSIDARLVNRVGYRGHPRCS